MLLKSIEINFRGEIEMKTLFVIGGVILIICGLIGFGYAAITTEQTNAIIGWVGGLILIIIGAYLVGKELKTRNK